ncbi:MAG: hypothetical protein V2I33_24065, partial [Kangiellaceae bacterium]|nr:hypothetical protein [Kangiellaceae bacterium]
MNVFQNQLEVYKEIPIKACKEVVFSHGGHMFAAAHGHIIQVYKFFTGENPSHMQYKGHSGKVLAIEWTEDDTGFVSVGADGN